MSDLYKEVKEPLRGLKFCPECRGEVEQDIFQLPKHHKKYGGRLIEAIGCHKCNIIFEVLPE